MENFRLFLFSQPSLLHVCLSLPTLFKMFTFSQQSFFFYPSSAQTLSITAAVYAVQKNRNDLFKVAFPWKDAFEIHLTECNALRGGEKKKKPNQKTFHERSTSGKRKQIPNWCKFVCLPGAVTFKYNTDITQEFLAVLTTVKLWLTVKKVTKF